MDENILHKLVLMIAIMILYQYAPIGVGAAITTVILFELFKIEENTRGGAKN